jgi:rare lipoprotein A
MRLLAATLFLCLCAGEAGALPRNCEASHYGLGDGYHGKRTASGEIMNAYAMTAAMPKPQPLRSWVTVTHGQHSIRVWVNDRGPFVRGRCIDLSTAAMRKLCGNAGTCRVRVSR